MGADAQVLTDVADALQRFEDSVYMDLPAWRDARMQHSGRPRVVSVEGRIKALRNKLAYAKRSRAAARASLRRMQKARDEESTRFVSSLFVAKVALASPLQSSRSFAQSWLDLMGGAASVSRPAIE